MILWLRHITLTSFMPSLKNNVLNTSAVVNKLVFNKGDVTTKLLTLWTKNVINRIGPYIYTILKDARYFLVPSKDMTHFS